MIPVTRGDRDAQSSLAMKNNGRVNPSHVMSTPIPQSHHPIININIPNHTIQRLRHG